MEVHRNGRQVPGFGLGSPVGAWVALRDGLIDANRLVATGRASELVDVGDERLPAIEAVPLLRERMDAGLGDPGPSTAVVHASPWKVAAVTGIAGTVTAWVMEEVARRVFRRGRRR